MNVMKLAPVGKPPISFLIRPDRIAVFPDGTVRADTVIIQTVMNFTWFGSEWIQPIRNFFSFREAI